MADQPLLKLLSKALELWLRQQCEAVQSLEIELLGTGRQPTAQQLELALVDLRVGDLQLQLGQLWRGQPLQLPLEIAITGLVGLTPEALSRSLLQPQWQALADDLAEQLLGVSPLVSLRIRDQNLVFQAQGVGSSTPLELETTLLAEDGGVRISATAGGNDALLPMGPAITVRRAAIEAGLVVLEGSATVITT